MRNPGYNEFSFMSSRLKGAACRTSALFAFTALGAATVMPQAASHKPPISTVEFSGFTIHITYSPKSLQTLQSGHETVIVAAYILGHPKPHAPKRLIDKEGRIDFDTLHREVLPGAEVVFTPFKLDKKTLDYLDAQGPQLLINVYSGRKSSQFNLLDCGLYEGSLAKLANQTLQISCKLIGEK